jgi:hypothetical protein
MEIAIILAELVQVFSYPTDQSRWQEFKERLKEERRRHDVKFMVSHRPLKMVTTIRPVIRFANRENLMIFLSEEKELAIEFHETELVALVHLLQGRIYGCNTINKLENSHFEMAFRVGPNQDKETIFYSTNMLTIKYRMFELYKGRVVNITIVQNVNENRIIRS